MARNRPPSGSEPLRLGVDRTWGVLTATGPARLIVDQASRMPGAALWPGPSGPWVSVPVSRAAFLSLEALGSPEWCSPEYVEDRAAWMRADPRWADAFARALSSAGGDPSALLEYQAASCAMAMSNGRGLFNASEQGTGKTRSTLAALAAMGARKTIIAAPKSVCVEWVKEARKPSGLFKGSPPFYAVSYADGPQEWKAAELGKWLAGPDPVVACVNYESLAACWPSVRRAVKADMLCAVVADESHRIKSDASSVGNVFREMAGASRLCFCTTGTPIGNDVGDLFPQAQAVAPMLVAGNYADFMARYATYRMKKIYVRGREQSVRQVSGARDMHDLMGRLSPIWFRATKAAVLNLPPKQYMEPVMLDLPPSVRALYDEVEELGEGAFDELSLSGALVRDLRLSQICGGFCPPASADWDDPPEAGKRVRDLESPKMDWLERFADERLRADPYHRVIVWGRFTHTIMRMTAVLEKVLGRGGRVSFVRGGCTWADEAIASLNSRDRYGVQVIVAQPRAIREGKNIQGADTVVYAENSYSWIDRAQSEDRCHRLGRDGGIQYWDLVIRKSIDERVLDALWRKEDFASTTAVGTVAPR